MGNAIPDARDSSSLSSSSALSDKLVAEYGLSCKQKSTLIEYIDSRGEDYVRQKARIVRSQPRRNAAGSLLAALRDDWQMPIEQPPGNGPPGKDARLAAAEALAREKGMELVTQAQEMERCSQCGGPMRARAEPITIAGRTIVLRPTVCPACAEPGTTSQPDSMPRKTKWQRLCPPFYQRDLPRAIRTRPWVDDVLGWQYGPQGLLLVGKTGTGKTRVMWHLLGRLLEQGRSVVVLDAVIYRSGVANAAREGETEIYVRRLSSAEVLYWDDFGQTHLSGAASEMLLYLVEQRTSHERPVLLTSRYSGGALESQFQRPEMGAAVRRRINEFCRVIEAC